MPIIITWKTALAAWESEYLTQETLWPHPTDEEMQLSILDPDIRYAIVEHIARCAVCADRFRQQQRRETLSVVQGWTVIQRKAAAGEAKEYPILYFSEKGEYKLEILQSTGGGNEGLVILSLTNPKWAAESEGKEYMVCDARGRTLLQKKVTHGKALQKIDRLYEIDDQSFLIRPLTSPNQMQGES
ncbi:MAG TPA: hypothetical protein PKW76_06230 [bacterium]|nr:hypothetical protein [bacterium]HPG45256.1 hypothetical protein [bacterium]HPM99025.1 hypothetical protein [bacterium]